MSDCENIFKSFSYNGKDTKTVLSSSELVLVSIGSNVDEIQGVKREVSKGDTTITRPIANEYGTIADSLEVSFSVIKSNYEMFTPEEQRTLERWLTSPKYSRELTCYDEDGVEICFYCGLFTETSWVPYGDGYIGMNFVFQNNAAYPYKKYSETFSIEGSDEIIIDCESDELEEYVYPKVTIYEPSETATVTIINTTDDDNTMTIMAYEKNNMIFDCKNCIPTDDAGIISYSDLGWSDVGNIYWLRLLPGDNVLDITGNVKIKIEYSYPYKAIGGML